MLDIIFNCNLITCILPKAKSANLVRLLHEEKGIETAHISSGRGIGTSKQVVFGVWDEVAILTVPVESHRAEEIFEFIYENGNVNRPKGGIILMNKITEETDFKLPDIAEEPID